MQADLAGLHLRPASTDAVTAFYSLIHIPLADQRALLSRIRDWLRPGGYFLAIVGARQWTGTAPYFGTDMFWDHADTATYLHWLQAARLTPIWNRHIPEGTAGILSSWPKHHDDEPTASHPRQNRTFASSTPMHKHRPVRLNACP